MNPILSHNIETTMLKYLQLLVCLLLFAAPAIAQDKKPNFKFGKISPEEMAMKEYPNDPAAPAVVLFDRASFTNRLSMNQGFLFEMERHVRIKIFKKEAYDRADISIPYYKDEKIIDLKASAFNLENGVMVETELSKANLFDEKLTRTRRVKKLTIPAVKEGTIIEYRYTRTNMDYDVPNWVFQDVEIPKIWSEYTASVPAFIEYKKFSMGDVPFSVATEEYRPSSANGLSYYCNEMHYIQENIPALKPEPFVRSVKSYLSQINFDVSVVYKPQVEANGGAYGSRLTNGPPIERSNTWEALGKELLEDVYQESLDATGATAPITATALAGKTAPNEMIASLYEYVGKNFKTDGYDIIWMTEPLDKIVKNRKGSPSELNILLINLLRRAKLNAFPVAISTVENGIIHPYRVSVEVFDRILTGVENADKSITIIDASAWPHPVGFLPEEDLNKEGLMMRTKDEITWAPLQNKALVRSALQANLACDDEGKIRGLMTFSETGYGAVHARDHVREKNADTYVRERYPELFVDGSFSDLKIENLENWQEPNIKGSFQLEATGFADVSGNKIYLNPSLGFGWKENPFKNPERKFDIDLGFPRTTVYSFTFAIPKGYKVEEIPKGSKMTFGENGILFEYFTEATAESVKVTIRRSIRQPLISVEFYADLQQFYGNIVSKLDEQVVLTKI